MKPTYVVVDGERIVTNFPWTTAKKDFDAFLKANELTTFVSDGDWWGTGEELYRCALARGLALATKSGFKRAKRKGDHAKRP